MIAKGGGARLALRAGDAHATPKSKFLSLTFFSLKFLSPHSLTKRRDGQCNGL